MNAAERARLRAEGRRRAAAELPDITPECARRIAELMREPINQYVATQRKKGPPGGRDGEGRATPSSATVTTSAVSTAHTNAGQPIAAPRPGGAQTRGLLT